MTSFKKTTKITYLILTLLSLIGILFFFSHMFPGKEPFLMMESGLSSEYINMQPTTSSSLLTSKTGKYMLEISRDGLSFLKSSLLL